MLRKRVSGALSGWQDLGEGCEAVLVAACWALSQAQVGYGALPRQQAHGEDFEAYHSYSKFPLRKKAIKNHSKEAKPSGWAGS